MFRCEIQRCSLLYNIFRYVNYVITADFCIPSHIKILVYVSTSVPPFRMIDPPLITFENMTEDLIFALLFVKQAEFEQCNCNHIIALFAIHNEHVGYFIVVNGLNLIPRVCCKNTNALSLGNVLITLTTHACIFRNGLSKLALCLIWIGHLSAKIRPLAILLQEISV